MYKFRYKTKLKWVAALRSGAYLQGKQGMRQVTEDGVIRYDALGVLCDVVDSSKWSKSGVSNFHLYDGSFSPVPPKRVTDSIPGLDSGQIALLVHMNDEEEKSFEDLAKHIDKALH